MEIFTVYFLMDLKIWRRSIRVRENKKTKKQEKNQNRSIVTPLYMGSEGFQIPLLGLWEMQKIKNLNFLLTMVKIYSNNSKINHLDI